MEDTITKSIAFILPKNSPFMNASFFIEEGYDRKYIIMLFKELESLGYGTFVQGKKGRGFNTQFIPSDKCPEKYELQIIQKKRGRKSKKVEK